MPWGWARTQAGDTKGEPMVISDHGSDPTQKLHPSCIDGKGACACALDAADRDRIPFIQAFITEDPELDREHQEIVHMVNGICGLLGSCRPPARVAQSMRVLAAKLESHFRTEEDLLAASGYPRLHDHAQVHDEFRRELDTAIHAVSSALIPDEVSVTVRRVLMMVVDHILRHDVRFKSHIQACRGI